MKTLTRLEKCNRTRLNRIMIEDPTFFSPRWISRYIVQSIRLCGNMSMAFDLMKEAKP